MTCALSDVTFARIALFVVIGGCLLISSLAFFIGCDAVGEAEGNGFGRFCGALVFGDGVGRRICALASYAQTSSANIEMRRKARAITFALAFNIRVDAFQPAGQPARFVPRGRRIADAVP